MKVIIDIEANGFNPDKIFCIICKDISNNKIYTFIEGEYDDFVSFSKDITTWIGHNIISYDVPVINRLLGTRIKVENLLDTLVLSRLFNVLRGGGHSLRNFGKLFNYPKIEFEDFTKYSQEMLDYCIQDVNLTHKVYNLLKREGKGFSKQCIRLEHSVQYLLEQQKDNGFYLDQSKAIQIRQECLNTMDEIEQEVLTFAKPKVKPIKEITPKYKKDGSMSVVGLKCVSDNPLEEVVGKCTLIKYEPFNLNSPKQVVERMNEYKWKPIVFNKPSATMKKKGIKKGTPKICPENVDTLPDTAPEPIKRISTYLMCTHRAATVDGWFNSLGKDNKVHGTVFSTGATTHRMGHTNPNMANIPSVMFDKDEQPVLGLEGKYGYDCRDCFTVDNTEQRRIVGVDAKAIQLRVFAHYVNNPEYTDAMINGDIHIFNRDLIGLSNHKDGRSIAKTFIYAFLLGGGDEKLGKIVGGTPKDGAILRETFMLNMKGLKKLKHQTELDASRGYMVGLDGRRIPVKSAHFALSSYLQGGEAVIMKTSFVLWTKKVKQLQLDAMSVALVHDEFQIDSHKDVAQRVGNIVVNSIRKTTDILKLNCPMDGDAKIGLTWANTH